MQAPVTKVISTSGQICNREELDTNTTVVEAHLFDADGEEGGMVEGLVDAGPLVVPRAGVLQRVNRTAPLEHIPQLAVRHAAADSAKRTAALTL